MKTNDPQLHFLPAGLAIHLPKHVRLKYALQERIGKMSVGEALPTIAALQSEFRLAQGTVVRVLRELQGEGLVEGRHGSGYFATGQRDLKNIAIYFSIDVLHPESGTFPSLLLKGLQRAAGTFEEVRFRHYFSAGSDCLWHDRICALEYDVRRRLVDGVILFGHYGGEFGDLPVPVVSWQLLPQVKARVLLDEESMVRQALAVLKARGCRSVAYMGGQKNTLPPADSPFLPIAQRQQKLLDFFLKESKHLGLETRPEWIVPALDGTGISAGVEHAKSGFTRLWNAVREKPDGMISTDDYRTLGALAAMGELGVAAGRDIQVASHVNRGSKILEGCPVIRLEIDPAEIAHALLGTVTALIEGRSDVPDIVLVEPHLAKD